MNNCLQNSKGWEIYKLSKLGGFSRGKGIPKKDIREEGITCLTYGDIYTKYNYNIKELECFIDEKTAKESKEIKFNDLLFTGSGETVTEVGKSVAYRLNDLAYAGGDILILSLPEKYRADYLAYYLNTISRKKINKLATGYSVAHINVSQLENLKVAIPDEYEQKRIVNIIEDWEKKIEVIERILDNRKKTFQATKNTLYSKKYKTTKVGKLTEEIKKINEDNNITRILSLSNTKGIVPIKEQFDREISSKDLSKYKIIEKGEYAYRPPGMTIGTIGRLNDEEAGLVSPAYVCFKLNEEKINTDYFSYWLKTNEAKREIKKNITTGVRESLSYESFSNMNITLPPLEKQEEIAQILNALQKEIDIIERLLENYRKQQKAVIHKLLS